VRVVLELQPEGWSRWRGFAVVSDCCAWGARSGGCKADGQDEGLRSRVTYGAAKGRPPGKMETSEWDGRMGDCLSAFRSLHCRGEWRGIQYTFFGQRDLAIQADAPAAHVVWFAFLWSLTRKFVAICSMWTMPLHHPSSSAVARRSLTHHFFSPRNQRSHVFLVHGYHPFADEWPGCTFAGVEKLLDPTLFPVGDGVHSFRERASSSFYPLVIGVTKLFGGSLESAPSIPAIC